MTRLAPLALLLVAGCHSRVEYYRVRAPDGGPECGVLECRSLVECYEAAGDLCPRGYRILDRDQYQDIRTVPNVADAYQASIQKRAVQQRVVSRNHVTIIFRCAERR